MERRNKNYRSRFESQGKGAFRSRVGERYRKFEVRRA